MKNKNNLNLVIAVGILLIVGCACPPPKSSNQSSTESPNSVSNTSNSNSSVSTTNSPPSNATTSFDYLTDGLQKVSAKWQKGGFGAIAIWKVTIKNVSDKPLGDIKFSTEYYSETGNIVSKGGTKGLLGKDTIEKVVPPKSTRTFEVNDGFVSDEADTASFVLESWRIIEKD